MSTVVQADLTRRRSIECEKRWPMPASAYIYGWVGVCIGAISVTIALIVVLLGRRWAADERDSRWNGAAVALFVAAFVALLFEIFVTGVAYEEASPKPSWCNW